MPLSAGFILNNRYRIVKLLGQGGFGAVYRAWDLNLNRACAVKENLETDPRAQQQFEREAKILANLNHPNLARVIDYFFIPAQGQYFVMDFVEGDDLGALLQKNGGPLPESQALPWIVQVCEALSYLHGQNPPIIHRDVKLANIKITPDGKAILVDFGIAKIYDSHLKTTVGARAVTPGYSPQEQYGQGGTDIRSDVYSLGATLYTLVTGREPVESIQRSLNTPLPAPRALNPSISIPIEQAILKAMEMQPANRYQSAQEFKLALTGTRNSYQLTGHIAAQTYTTAGLQVLSGRSGLWGNKAFLVSLFALAAVTLLGFGYWLATRQGQPGTGEAAGLLPATTVTPQLSAVAGTPIPTPGSTKAPTAIPPVDTAVEATSGSPVAVGSIQVSTVDGMVLAYIPTSDFIMGSTDNEAEDIEKPAHPVYLDAYWIDLTEVTNAMFEQFVLATGHTTLAEKTNLSYTYEKETGKWREAVGYNWRHPWGPSSRLSGRMDHPVVHVAWADAAAYCAWAGRRLPSEAEWENAARGEQGYRYPWGNTSPNASLLNYDYKVGDTKPVGSYPDGASPYGLLDMAGNVWEWLNDWYSETYYSNSPDENPQGPSSGKYRVVRGGSWNNRPAFERAANRSRYSPDFRSIYLGFRCAMDAEQ